MVPMFIVRPALVLVCAGALAVAACGKNSSAATTTSPSVTPADATINEPFTTTLQAGGTVFYSFSIAQYGNVAVTLTGVAGADLPEDFTLNVGIGRPSGTSCTSQNAIDTAPGESPQLTGAYGPGVFCVRVSDTGKLPAPATIAAVVAHS